MSQTENPSNQDKKSGRVFTTIDQDRLYQAAKTAVQANPGSDALFKQDTNQATGQSNWSGPTPAFGKAQAKGSEPDYANKGLLPKPVDGYLDIMEKHWGESDLTKVNEDLAKTLGDRYDPAFKQNLTAAVYTGSKIDSSKGDDWNPDSETTTDAHGRAIKNLKHDGQSDSWVDWNGRRYGPGHSVIAGPQGKMRIGKFQRPVMNLLKIVRKLRDFSHLSEAYREKHMEVEQLTLTIRKLYYILIFIKDQIKHVAGVEDDIHRLIEMIVRETTQWKRLITAEQLQKLRSRQYTLKKDRERLEQVFEIASKSILRKLSKMGASMTDITDLDDPNIDNIYGSWKKVPDINQTEDNELSTLFQEYNQAVKGQKEQIQFLMKLPGRENLSEKDRQDIEDKINEIVLEVTDQLDNDLYKHQVEVYNNQERAGLGKHGRSDESVGATTTPANVASQPEPVTEATGQSEAVGGADPVADAEPVADAGPVVYKAHATKALLQHIVRRAVRRDDCDA